MADKEQKHVTPIRFGEPEKRNWPGIVIALIFILGGIIAIIWMVHSSPRQHALTCRTEGTGSWHSIGRCTEID
jgi:hypothetical protein